MQTSGATGLSDASALSLFMRFPAPLALFSADGDFELANAQFGQCLDVRCLETDEIVRLVADPGKEPRSVKLIACDGSDAVSNARAMRFGGRVLLALDATPGSMFDPGIRQLHARILELERLTSTDHLTTAWNRAHLDRTIESELSRSTRYRQPLSLILIDVDHFKQVNDRYGHQVGDTVLCEVVDLIRSRLRTGDLLFRWGGDELAVLTTSSGYRAAGRLAERLHAAVDEARFTGVGSVTVSLGVAEHCGTESHGDWFRRVDAALYQAKEAGRSRVSVDKRGDSDTWAARGRRSTLKLVWQEAYESGNAVIDDEHRTLFMLANALIDMSLNAASPDHISAAALDKLLAHIVRHFADEEEQLRLHGYGRLAAHKAAHESLVARALALREKADADSLGLGELVQFLANDVVARHLLLMDRDFFPLFSDGADSRASHS